MEMRSLVRERLRRMPVKLLTEEVDALVDNRQYTDALSLAFEHE